MTKSTLSNTDIHTLLAERREVAIIWCIEDVLELRPDLSEDAAWVVLQACKRGHDANFGLSWDGIETAADCLFPSNDASE